MYNAFSKSTFSEITVYYTIQLTIIVF